MPGRSWPESRNRALLLPSTASSCIAYTTNSPPQSCRWLLSARCCRPRIPDFSHIARWLVLQVQLLQKHDAILEKSVQALAADVTGKDSRRAHPPLRARIQFPSNAPPAVEASASLNRAEVLKLQVRSASAALARPLTASQADLASSRAECTGLKSLVEQVNHMCRASPSPADAPPNYLSRPRSVAHTSCI